MDLLLKSLAILAAVVAALALALVLAGQLGLLHGRPPADLGVHDGRLKAPSRTANSVSSQARLFAGHPQAEAAQVEPFHYSGNGAIALERLARVVEESARTRIVSRNAEYLRAESTTALLGFTDDLEFWLDPAQGVIQVRSASRLGQRDFGANRERVEALRRAFAG